MDLRDLARIVAYSQPLTFSTELLKMFLYKFIKYEYDATWTVNRQDNYIQS